VSKAWYNFFLVTDDRPASDRPQTPATPDGAAAALRRGSEGPAEAGLDVSFTAPVTNRTPLTEIYSSAQIAVPAHGYTVLKVAEMLQSEHIRALSADVKRKSILVALEAAGVSIDEIVADAVHRDRALDTYERVLQKNLDTLRSEKETENARLEQEIAERLSELRARIEENNQGVSRELDNLRAWQASKQAEEQRIADTVGYFVSENPVTTTAAPSTDDKGDANARQV
jgi:Asp-tRNA(Asn)/Glu-tRNA(Gln) amidotransferase A subunit family amidase